MFGSCSKTRLSTKKLNYQTILQDNITKVETKLSNVICAERLHVMSPSAFCQPSTVVAESLLTSISSSLFTAKLFSILM